MCHPRFIITHLLLLIGGLNDIAYSQNWEGMGVGFDNAVRDLYVSQDGEKLFVGGAFKFADNLMVNGITVWDGLAFDSLGGGETNCFTSCGPVLKISEFEDEVYAGGYIYEMGETPTLGIGRWDGSNWNDVLGGTNGRVQGFYIYESDLYACGSFDSIGGVLANGVAYWDGTVWESIGDFPNSWGVSSSQWMNIGSIIEFQGDILVAGLFPEGAGLSHSIARWDGSNWGSVGNSIQGVNVWINDMDIYQGELYVAGHFFQEHGNLSSGILRWDGTSWHGIGDGVEFGAQVFDLQIYNDYLYASGNFTSMSGINASRIAKWNGEQWCGLGSTFNNSISSMAVFRDTLYVACGTEVDGIQVNYLAKWLGDDYVDTCATVTGIADIQEHSSEPTIYPNPTASTTTLTWQGQSHGNYQLQLYDGQGKQIAPPILPKGEGMCEIDMSALPSGIYFGRLLVGEKTHHTFKVIKE